MLTVFAVYVDLENCVSFLSAAGVASKEEGIEKIKAMLIDQFGISFDDDDTPSETQQLLFYTDRDPSNQVNGTLTIYS